MRAFAYFAEGWRGYAISVLLVIFAAGVRAGIGYFEPRALLFSPFYPVVLFATLIGGLGPGLLATFLSLVVVGYAFIPPAFTFSVAEKAGLVNLALFLFSALVILWLADSYRGLLRQVLAADAQRQILLDELRHRSRNSISAVQAIVQNTLKTDGGKAQDLMGRLKVILSAEALFINRTGGGEDLRSIVLDALRPYGLDRCEVSGERVAIPAQHARSWALIVHELATNAAKYGALAADSGVLKVDWTADGSNIEFRWLERGGPPRSADAPSTGFGTKLMNTMVASFSGTIERKVGDSRFECVITMPRPSPTSSGPAPFAGLCQVCGAPRALA